MILTLVITLLLVLLLVYGVGLLPIDARLIRFVQAAIVIIAAIVLLQRFGVLS